MRARLAALLVSLVAAGAAVGQGAGKPAAGVAPTEPRVRAALLARVTPGVVVETVRLEGEVARFSGTAASNQDLSNYLRALDRSTDFTAIDLRQVEASGKGYRYDASIKVRCAVEKSAAPGSLCAPAGKAGSIHKCRINGTLTFQATPCAPGEEA